MTEQEKINKELWEEQRQILGETDENLNVFVTNKQLALRLKMLFNKRKEYLGEDKPVNKITPIVSVCIPTYQHKNYIEECLKGALMQETTFPYEIIVCDDGSTDDTTEICRDYAEKYQAKIRLYDHNRAMTRLFDSDGNVKSGHNWWWSLESARGKYIAICEGDDYWTDPCKLQKQADFLEKNPDYGLVHTGYCLYIEDKKEFRNWDIKRTQGWIFDDLLLGNQIGTLTTLFRTELANNSYFHNTIRNKKFKMGDYPLWLFIAQQMKIGYIDEQTSVYRVLQESAGRSDNEYKNYLFERSVLDVKFYFANNEEKYTQILRVEESQFYQAWLRKAVLVHNLEIGREAYSFLKKKNVVTIKDYLCNLALQCRFFYYPLVLLINYRIDKTKNV
jgi:Glycosyltransferases involved in cell wall biogenesis